MSRPFTAFVHPGDRERTRRQNAEVRRGGQAVAFENRYLCKNGSYRWLLWHAAPDTGERAIYSVASDITALKLADAERERQRRELAEAVAELKRAGPVLSVCGYCREILHDDASWSVERYVNLHSRIRLSHGICQVCLEAEL